MATWEYVEKLSKLSGMAYCSYKYNASEWIDKTGIDPTAFKEIHISKTGLCGWTKKAEDLIQARINRVKQNWRALGV